LVGIKVDRATDRIWRCQECAIAVRVAYSAVNEHCLIGIVTTAGIVDDEYGADRTALSGSEIGTACDYRCLSAIYRDAIYPLRLIPYRDNPVAMKFCVQRFVTEWTVSRVPEKIGFDMYVAVTPWDGEPSEILIGPSGYAHSNYSSPVV
jgi:hypothetical protein